MAETGIAIRLSLKDAEVVARALEQLGGQGERALKRIEAAARSLGHETPAAFRAMEVAAEEAKGKFEEFGHHAGQDAFANFCGFRGAWSENWRRNVVPRDRHEMH